MGVLICGRGAGELSLGADLACADAVRAVREDEAGDKGDDGRDEAEEAAGEDHVAEGPLELAARVVGRAKDVERYHAHDDGEPGHAVAGRQDGPVGLVVAAEELEEAELRGDEEEAGETGEEIRGRVKEPPADLLVFCLEDDDGAGRCGGQEPDDVDKAADVEDEVAVGLDSDETEHLEDLVDDEEHCCYGKRLPSAGTEAR